MPVAVVPEDCQCQAAMQVLGDLDPRVSREETSFNVVFVGLPRTRPRHFSPSCVGATAGHASASGSDG
jgi:hypothetical protein